MPEATKQLLSPPCSPDSSMDCISCIGWTCVGGQRVQKMEVYFYELKIIFRINNYIILVAFIVEPSIAIAC